MIIGTIIYSVIAEFDSFISDGEEPWYPSITDHSSLELDQLNFWIKSDCFAESILGQNVTRCHNDEVAYKKCITQWRHFLRGNPTERQIENYRINNDECT
ncbi:hypothetical protein HN873_041142 [Arachis hypogaea]